MNTLITYILSVIFWLCAYQASAQKVLILRNTKTESKDGNVYVLKGQLDNAKQCHRNSRDEFVIPVGQDSVYIYGRDESLDKIFSDGENFRPPSYYISHIGSYAADTI